jgi:hypothetical protein
MKARHLFIWAAVLIAWSIGLAVNGATVTGTIRARDGSTMKTWINFAVPSAQRPVVGSNDIRPGWTLSTNSTANGTFRVVLYQGDYTVQVGNDTLDKFNILVPSGTATYDISQLTTNAVTPLSLVSAWVPSTNGSAYSLKLPAFGATSGYVWTCTNATTGAGHWAVSSGGSGSLFEADDDSNLMPISGTSTDTLYELDDDDNIMPQ